MYENIKIEKSLLEIAESWAKALGWPELKTAGPYRGWLKPLREPLKKHQFNPAIYVEYGRAIRVYGLDWHVVWYGHDGHMDGVHIVGWPDQELMTRLLDESPGLREAYEQKNYWLAANPEYRERPPGPKTTKKAIPKDYMIDGRA